MERLCTYRSIRLAGLVVIVCDSLRKLPVRKKARILDDSRVCDPRIKEDVACTYVTVQESSLVRMTVGFGGIVISMGTGR